MARQPSEQVTTIISTSVGTDAAVRHDVGGPARGPRNPGNGAMRYILATLLLIAMFGAAAAEQKRVLLLHSFERDFAPRNAYGRAIREELGKPSTDPVDILPRLPLRLLWPVPAKQTVCSRPRSASPLRALLGRSRPDRHSREADIRLVCTRQGSKRLRGCYAAMATHSTRPGL